MPSGGGRVKPAARRREFSQASSTRVTVRVPYEEQRRGAFYALDWDGSNGRAMSVTVRDTVTGNTLDTVSVSSFGAGKWLLWTVSGPVEFVFTKTAGADACISGVFVDPAPSGSAFYPTYLSETFVQEPSGSGLVRSRGADRANAALDRSALLDGLGSVQGTLVAGSGGGASTMTGLVARDAFGAPLSGSGPSATGDQPFQYLGGLGYWEEPELGLTYVRARWLDTATGSWMSVDPVDGEPRYSYVHNSPTMATDPTGTQSWNFHKWLYTGDPYASDDVYNAALGQAAETLETSSKRITDYVAVNRSHVEAVVRRFAESRRQGVGKQETGGYLITTACHFIAGLNPIGRSLTLFSQSFNHLLGGAPAKSWAQARQELPPYLKIFVPPFPGSTEHFEYSIGFLWGLIDTLIGFINIPEQVAGIFQTLIAISKSEDFWDFLKKLVAETWAAQVQKIMGAGQLKPFDHGKMAAQIGISLVLFVLSAKQLINKIKLIPGQAAQLRNQLSAIPKSVRDFVNKKTGSRITSGEDPVLGENPPSPQEIRSRTTADIEEDSLFRGDKQYIHGQPVGASIGSEAWENAKIKYPHEHVSKKESSDSSRFTSFSTKVNWV